MSTTLAVTPTGDIIHLDANGERDFSPRTQAAIRMAAAVFLTVLATLALGLMSGVVEPAAWSPMGQVQEEAPIPTVPDFQAPAPMEPPAGPGVAI